MQRDIVVFEKGAILRKEMLESMYLYPRIVCEGFYSGYSDGILYGLQWVEQDGKQCITPGALKYKGEIYFQQDPVFLDEHIENLEAGCRYFICFREKAICKQSSLNVFELALCFVLAEKERPEMDDGFCYKYIKYERDGIKLLDHIAVFGLYAAPQMGCFCIPMDILQKEILPLVEQKQSRHPFDYSILDHVYHNMPLSVKFAESYIMEYQAVSGKPCSDLEIKPENTRKIVNAFKEAIPELVLKASAQTIVASPETENEKSIKGGRML